MIKKIIKSINIFLLLLIFSFCFTKLSKMQTFAENSSAPNLGSDGYYEISTVDELYWFADLVNGTLTDGTEKNSSANARLLNDIVVNENVLNEDGSLNGDGSNFREWVPIGNSATADSYFSNIKNKYYGVFDGNGKTISGLYYNDAIYYVGFVGVLGDENVQATIKNLTIANSYFYNGKSRVGAIAGLEIGSIIENCASINNTIKCNYDAGGIVGWTYSGGKNLDRASQVLNCYNTSNVIGISYDAGGIVGSIQNNSIIKNCYNTGKITVENKNYKERCGGIIGNAMYESYASNVENCYYLKGSVERGLGNREDIEGTILTTEEDFASGKVTYLLNERKSDDTVSFRQTCGGGYPEFTGEIVYYGYDTDNCSDTVQPVYTNDSTNLLTEKPEHADPIYVYNNDGTHNVVCPKCVDILEENVNCTNVNGKCEYCGGCQHLNYTNGFCDECDDYQPANLNDNGTPSDKNDDYYEITNPGQLYYFMALVNSGKTSINAKLLNNIIVNQEVTTSSETNNQLRTWVAIGDSTNKFKGTFDGDNKIISGLYYSGDAEVMGLFGYVENGTIKNVIIDDSYFTSANDNSKIGSFVGINQGGTVINCHTTSKVKVNGSIIGGIVGQSSSGNVSKCSNMAIVTGSDATGGIAGYILSNANIENSYNAGEINGDSFNGGIVGETSADTFVKNCYNKGTIKGNGTNGNIVGKNQGTITNCYYLSGSISKSVGTDEGITTDVLEMDNNDFNTGKVTYLLNNQASNENNAWKQTLGEDDYPVFTGEIVNYSNRTKKYYNQCDHSEYLNGICSLCGTFDEPTLNVDNYYELNNLGQFLWFQEKVNNGDTSINAKLMNNIDLSNEDEIGIGNTETNPYKGIFDGNKFTITINIISDKQYAALFPFVDSGTIKNLIVEGNITTTQKYAASIIGKTCGGNVTLEKCVSFVVIQSNIDNETDHDGTHGGLIAIVGKEKTYINYCGFAGEINGEKTTNCGGLIGWIVSNQIAYINNSYVAAKFNLENDEYDAIARYDTKYMIARQITNCYYIDGLNMIRTDSDAKKVDESAFKTGEVTYLLNGKRTDGTQAWYQTCGEGFPKISGETVYYGYSSCHADSLIYSNDNLPSEPQEHQEYINGICSNCHAYQEATLNNNYYEISNAGQFLWFANKVNSGSNNINGKLIENINLENITWNVIGTKDKPYKGTFDGNYKEIYNFELNAAGTYAGLFGVVEENTIKNFTIRGNITITGNVEFLGSAVASAEILVTIEGIISYVNITDNNAAFDITNIGGVVGRLGKSSGQYNKFRSYLKKCTNYGNISIKKSNNVGGIIGLSGYCVLENCNNFGKINSENALYVGGIVGYNARGTKIKNSINAGELISGNGAYMGGIISYVGDPEGDFDSIVEYCANLAMITYTSEEDGYIGGILAYVNYYYFDGISNCYNYGKINSNSNSIYQGAIIGYCEKLNDYQKKKITNNYYLNTSYKTAYHAGLNNNFAKTKEQFATGEVAFFLGTNWGQDLSKDIYPFLGKTPVEARCEFYKQTTNIMDDLSMKYYVIAFDNNFDSKKLVVEFFFLGEIIEVSATYEEETGYYTFTLKGINPQCMGDNIKATLKYDNNVKEVKEEYSVETNLLELINEITDELFENLIKSILVYGQTAGIYNEYESLTGSYSVNNLEMPESTINLLEPFSGYTVHFGSLNYLKVKFTLENGEKIFLNGVDMTTKKTKAGDSYILMTEGISSKDFAKIYSFTIYASDGTEKAKLSLCVNDYLYTISQNNNASVDMKNLSQALYNYGRYTVIYQHRETGSGNHIYDETYTNNFDGTHSKFCVCGYELINLHEHDHTTYQCICGDEATLIDLSTYTNGDEIDITNSVYIIGDDNEHQVTLNILENAEVFFRAGTSGVKLSGSINIAAGKTLTLIVLDDAEHLINGSIILGNNANLIIEGDKTNENNKLTISATNGNMAIGANSNVTAGDIIINNANIEANGSSTESKSSPAIGVTGAKLNNIIIKNSNVVAVGSSNTNYASQAIGIGSDGGSIENITFINSSIVLGKMSLEI